jgi:hypothetical protein
VLKITGFPLKAAHFCNAGSSIEISDRPNGMKAKKG